MGTDKSFVLLEGKPLIQHVIERASSPGYPLILIANDVERYRLFGLPVYSDVIAGAGSLGGLYTALTHSPTDYTLCLACDMPQVKPELLQYLITLKGAHDAVVPRVAGVLQGVHALYHRRCLPIMQGHIQQGTLKIIKVIEALNVRLVDEGELRQFDPDCTSFLNLNSPLDLEAFQRIKTTKR